jgi:Domain of unknown function (DUF6471)
MRYPGSCPPDHNPASRFAHAGYVLVKWLKKHGFKTETKASITNKLARDTFPATFFLACLAALELDGVALGEI